MKWTPQSMKWFLNLYPPYLFTGTRVVRIGTDWKEIVVKVRKSILTRNYVGVTFGGSLYAATDPHFMLMLCQILGLEKYIIWDQAAHIEFLKPARSTITFHFKITNEEIEKVIHDVKTQIKIRPVFVVTGLDEEGVPCVRVTKTLYVRLKRPEPPPIAGQVDMR